MGIYQIFFALALFTISYAANNDFMSDEKRLIKHLLDNYERVGLVGRPVYNTSETVRVSFGLALIQILDVDEQSQVLTTRTWMRHAWNDILLKWNPADFGGVDHIRVPINRIWSPDIVLYNSVQQAGEFTSNLNNGGAMAVVSSDGNILWIPAMNFKSTCSFDFTNFPYDIQMCMFKFGSWTYDGFKLDVNFYDSLEQFDLTDYIRSNEWEVLDASARRNVKYYPCCAEPYPDLTFTLKIKRICSGNQYAMVLPTSLLSILAIVMFCIPPVMDAKINLGAIIFLGCFLLLNTVNDLAPHGGAAYSRLVQYLSVEICLVTLAIVFSTVTMNLARKGKRGIALPGFFKTVFNNCIGRILCVCAASKEKTDDKTMRNEKDEKQQDWETFATIVDRIFCVIFAILTIIFAIVMR